MTWREFHELFMGKYFLATSRHAKAREFLELNDRPKTRCVKYVPKCASARIAPSNVVYTWYGYRSKGTGVLTTEVLLFRQYLNK